MTDEGLEQDQAPEAEESPRAPERLTFRVGRRVGRHVYLQLGEEPSDDDPPVGMMDTDELASAAVFGMNKVFALESAAAAGKVRVEVSVAIPAEASDGVVKPSVIGLSALAHDGVLQKLSRRGGLAAAVQKLGEDVVGTLAQEIRAGGFRARDGSLQVVPERADLLTREP